MRLSTSLGAVVAGILLSQATGQDGSYGRVSPFFQLTLQLFANRLQLSRRQPERHPW